MRRNATWIGLFAGLALGFYVVEERVTQLEARVAVLEAAQECDP